LIFLNLSVARAHRASARRTFEVWTPVRLAKQFNASIYASVRQYVSKNHRACAVVVLNMPALIEGDGFRANLRRVVQAPAFTETFGNDIWNASYYTPGDEIGRLIPLGKRKSSGKRNMVLVDRNGVRHECIAESFTQGHQVFREDFDRNPLPDFGLMKRSGPRSPSPLTHMRFDIVDESTVSMNALGSIAATENAIALKKQWLLG
jgi:hypothetical protein